jgi:hypothetical protein
MVQVTQVNDDACHARLSKNGRWGIKVCSAAKSSADFIVVSRVPMSWCGSETYLSTKAKALQNDGLDVAHDTPVLLD